MSADLDHTPEEIAMMLDEIHCLCGHDCFTASVLELLATELCYA